jgi:predicted NACHT family NTPase
VQRDLRGLVRKAVCAVIGEYAVDRIVLTCRTRSYSGMDDYPDFQVYTLAPFNKGKIFAFAGAWYSAQRALGKYDKYDKEEAAEKIQDLVFTAVTPEFYGMAQNPMLLTTMALLHQHGSGLPKERVRLYSKAVDVLLHRWQASKVGDIGLGHPAALTNCVSERSTAPASHDGGACR